MISNDINDIFTEPPDGLGENDFYFGTFVAGIGSMEGIEVARTFAEAANRLLESAKMQRESWEAAYPILFCYRHALELYLKALLPNAKHGHQLGELAQTLKTHLDRRYPENQVTWMLSRIAEFDRLDPKSTVFRYHDGSATSYKSGEHPNPELWVDFKRLQKSTAKLFHALEMIYLHL
jgi:HEPN domain-containing protein